MAKPSEAVGLVGAGLLGSALAERLRAAGYELLVFDLVRERAEAAGVPARSPAEIAARCRRVLLSLPDTDAVKSALYGGEGLLAAEDRTLELVLDTTTGDPEATESLARGLAEEGIRFLDVCVSGSSADVRQGRAVLLAGGTEDDLHAVQDILDALAPAVFHLGGVGSGARAKLAVNLVLGLQRLALAEGLVYAEKEGLDPNAFLEVLRAGPAHARVVETKGPKMAGRDFRPAARLAQHLKDVRLILECARRRGLTLPLSALHAEILEEAVRLGLGDLDNSAVIEALRARADLASDRCRAGEDPESSSPRGLSDLPPAG